MNRLDLIKDELNVFIEKFYKNQFIKGFIIFCTLATIQDYSNRKQTNNFYQIFNIHLPL